MDQNQIVPENEEALEKGEYAVHRNLRVDMIAAVLCLLLAFVAWLVVMNLEDTDYIAIDTTGFPAGYSLSVTELEVKGPVASLKNAGKIKLLYVPEGLTPGDYTVPEAYLILPDGLELTETPSIILTVAQ